MKRIGKAGFTSQFVFTTNTQKGMVMPRAQKLMYTIPPNSLAGPEMQQLQRNRLRDYAA